MDYKHSCVIDAQNLYKTFVLVLFVENEEHQQEEQVQYYELLEGESLVDTAPPVMRPYAGADGFVAPKRDKAASAWVEAASAEEIAAWEAEHPAPERPQPDPDLTTQYAAAMRAFASTSTEIADTYALDMPDLFPTWAAALEAGEELLAGRVLSDGGQLYRVVQAVTPLESQPPHGAGMLAIYRPIDQQHAGTAEDPIPWVMGMDCIAGKHYSYKGKVYRVAVGGSMTPCVWPPDTPGMWQWEVVV